jgi:tRNA-specific 2-thiouridylase
MSESNLVIVALSGGVDSAVAAMLLRDEGRDVQCLHMTNWEDDAYCESAEDFQDARKICRQLDLPLHRVNFSDEYYTRVFETFLQELARGRTPNPDVLCNREIKFGLLRKYASRLGGRWLATGHYARTKTSGSTTELYKGRDASKDQSYFLHSVSQDDLGNVLFPLGELTKREVRAMADAARLDVADKRDSTGICFIGERPFSEFLQRYIPKRPGTLRAADGEVLGTHEGLAFYTIGQRHGLNIGGRANRLDTAWYVARKDLEANELIVVQGHDHPALLSERLVASTPHWINGPPAGLETGRRLRLLAKTRYRQADQPCTAYRTGEGRLVVEFDLSQRAVTPGQYVVFYDGERCMGGATIEETTAVVGANLRASGSSPAAGSAEVAAASLL